MQKNCNRPAFESQSQPGVKVAFPETMSRIQEDRYLHLLMAMLSVNILHLTPQPLSHLLRLNCPISRFRKSMTCPVSVLRVWFPAHSRGGGGNGGTLRHYSGQEWSRSFCTGFANATNRRPYGLLASSTPPPIPAALTPAPRMARFGASIFKRRPLTCK